MIWMHQEWMSCSARDIICVDLSGTVDTIMLVRVIIVHPVRRNLESMKTEFVSSMVQLGGRG